MATNLAPANTVLGQVERQVSDARLQIAMTMAPFLEGGGSSPIGSGGWGVGDQGHSYGPYQINLPYHPGQTAASATNPSQAVAYMLSAYQSAEAKVSSALWGSNPAQAAEETIYYAEHPSVDYYSSHGTSAVNQAYANAVNALASADPNIGATAAAGNGSSGGGPQVYVGPAPTASSTLAAIKAWLIRFNDAVFRLAPGSATQTDLNTSNSWINAQTSKSTLLQSVQSTLQDYPQAASGYATQADAQAYNASESPTNTAAINRALGIGNPFSGIASGIVRDVGTMIEDVFESVTGPIVHFFEDALAVIVGIILVIIAIKIVAHDSETSDAQPAPAAERSSSEAAEVEA